VVPLLAVYAMFVLLCPAKLRRPDTVFTLQENIQIAEAQAWWSGRLDLPERKHDSALFDGRVYSPFPPLFSRLAAALLANAALLFYHNTGYVQRGLIASRWITCPSCWRWSAGTLGNAAGSGSAPG